MEDERPPTPEGPTSVPDEVELIPLEDAAQPESPREPEKPERPFALSITVGLVVSLVLGGIWAAIAIATDREIGFIAWMIGLGVGAAMAWAAGRRSTRLGVAAVLLSLVGLVAGKVMTAEIGLVDSVVDEILADPYYVNGLAYRVLADDGQVSPEVQAWWEDPDAANPPPDAIAGEVAALEEQIIALVATTPEEEKRAWAEPIARTLIAEASPVDRYSLSMYDGLWVLLAVGAAWGMAAPRRDEAG